MNRSATSWSRRSVAEGRTGSARAFHVKSGTLVSLGDCYGLDSHQLAQMRAILGELENHKNAPTAVRDAQRATDVHLADSLVALELEVVRMARTIADLGSGAGFPGAALAVALPAAGVSLIESQGRKCGFLEGMLAEVGVENANVVCVRVEEWHDGIGCNDVVVTRAVAAQVVVLEYAAPVLRLGGTLVDWRGRRAPAEEDAALAAAEELGLERVEVRRVQPWPRARDRHLHIFVKVEETPGRFPRRPGIARKRPLGHRGAR
jgi:16S rRNA (guanine527-N7)-methyltransferase